ncbi:hypothetical protein B0A48_09013 [Cryoendolithus antarcticus]|uniref:Peptidase metallopeptidase domain-containing protein n=1 Tax=Cryoendolithus antarcticus TaxID=1507870 RepID=A0A1V8T1G3_9PEZI|nr:hypothetical protein B0A48_09013 [Cryoendolithus antarcticus]
MAPPSATIDETVIREDYPSKGSTTTTKVGAATNCKTVDTLAVDFSEVRTCTQLSSPGKTTVVGTQFSGPGSAALDNRKLWPNGTTLMVSIFGASPFVESKIKQFAVEWSNFANIQFVFVAPGNSDIHITCTPGGSWSYIGTDARHIPQDQPSMNFGWFNDQTADDEFRRVVVHEFGHAIGCIHEQSSPVSNIPWNKPVVYAYYLKSNGWDQAMVDSQVFAVADPSVTVDTPFDRTSIMEYSYPASFTLDGSSAPWNTDLSDIDKTFIMQLYPNFGLRRTTNDGVYLVNCFKGSEISSGVAYYSFLGSNDGQQPTAYIDVTKGSNVIWEGSPGSVSFPDGNTVNWAIVANAGSLGTYSHVGSARNKFESWNVYKDKYRLLYQVDGWSCYTVYWCF